MALVDKMIKKQKESKQLKQDKKANVVEESLTLDELEFLIRLIGNSNFKGNDLMFIFDLVNKLQNLYLDKKGVQ